MNKLNNKGFTLVEILAVISILAFIIIIVGTSGFGAFDNAKTAISKENEKAIYEAANFLMTEVKNCNNESDEILYSNLLDEFIPTDKTCEALKSKAKSACLYISLKYLLENNYISGSGVEEIYKLDPDFKVKACLKGDNIEISNINQDGTLSNPYVIE